MPSAPQQPFIARPEESLTPLERALISAHTVQNTRLAEALEKSAEATEKLAGVTSAGFERLNGNVPALRVVYAGGAAVLAGVFALVAFVIAGLLQLQGADVEAAARATSIVVTSGPAPDSPPVAPQE